jgi:hypothetical protein
MPSPFPGMDPFIENQEWTDFHTRFITVIGEVLTPRLRQRYIVRIERRVYVEHLSGGVESIIPDVTVLKSQVDHRPSREVTPSAVSTAAPAPVECTLPMPEEKREAFIVIRGRRSREVAAVIELLSPTNKLRGADGFREYMKKRESVLQSSAHLVELDLLRGGRRLPTIDPLPDGDYYAFVCRRERRPKAQVHAWTIRDRLPAIPVPLSENDPDVELDLQEVFTVTYDRAAYEDSIDYAEKLSPPLAGDDSRWIQEILRPR